MTSTELLAAARALPEDERLALAEALLEDEGAFDEGVEAAWGDELQRRLDDIDAGRVTLIPHEEVMATIRARLVESRVKRAG